MDLSDNEHKHINAIFTTTGVLFGFIVLAFTSIIKDFSNIPWYGQLFFIEAVITLLFSFIFGFFAHIGIKFSNPKKTAFLTDNQNMLKLSFFTALYGIVCIASFIFSLIIGNSSYMGFLVLCCFLVFIIFLFIANGAKYEPDQ